MKKLIAVILSITIIGSLLAGCGKTAIEDTNESAVESSPIIDSADKAAEENTGEEAEVPTEPETLEFENFTSGTIYDQGEYYFHIDSMEMTDEGYVITYRVASDPQGYTAYCDMSLIVNGVTFHYDDFTYSYDSIKRNTMICTGRDNAATVTLDKETLIHAGITEVTSVQFDGALGYVSSTNSIYEDVEIHATVFPGAKVDTKAQLPTPKNEAWVLVDNEFGTVQITDAVYWRSASEPHQIMGIRLYILAQGNSTSDDYSVKINGLTADGWEANDQMFDYIYWLGDETSFYYVTIYSKQGDPAEDTDFSQTMLNVEDTNGDISRMIDFSGLGDL